MVRSGLKQNLTLTLRHYALPVLAAEQIPKPSGPGRNCQIEAHTQLQNSESFHKPRAQWLPHSQELAAPPCLQLGCCAIQRKNIFDLGMSAAHNAAMICQKIKCLCDSVWAILVFVHDSLTLSKSYYVRLGRLTLPHSMKCSGVVWVFFCHCYCAPCCHEPWAEQADSDRMTRPWGGKHFW